MCKLSNDDRYYAQAVDKNPMNELLTWDNLYYPCFYPSNYNFFEISYETYG